MLEIDPEQPVLIMMMGLPLTGKTTTAQEIAAELTAPVVSYRELTRALAGGVIAPGLDERVRRIIQDTVGWYLLNAHTVVYDATNATREMRRPLLEIAAALEIPVYGVWMTCVRAVQRRRIEAAQYSVELADRIARLWEAPSTDEGFVSIVTMFSDREGATLHEAA